MKIKPFGALMKERRKDAGMTLQELADLAKPCSVSHLSQIERNFFPDADGTPQRPSLDLLDRLAAALNIPLDEARLAANYPLPLSEEDAYAVEINANLRELPEHARVIVLAQVRAVRQLFAGGENEQREPDEKPDDRPGEAPPSRGVKPGDPEYREPSGTIKAPPRKKGHTRQTPQRKRNDARRAS